ncbi:hypothetical protein [Neorhizobium sp. DT-125]|uniref:hypothetical protein n=1 Tax=Neorhizobium sp. DT-125 TaxID=3396163 RepID=UPI003F1BF90A
MAFFPVLERSENELVLGVDDRHLDFRISILLGALKDKKRFRSRRYDRCSLSQYLGARLSRP